MPPVAMLWQKYVMQKIEVYAEVIVADNSIFLEHMWGCELAKYLSEGRGTGERSVRCHLHPFHSIRATT